jgi:hypothetical protein
VDSVSRELTAFLARVVFTIRVQALPASSVNTFSVEVGKRLAALVAKDRLVSTVLRHIIDEGSGTELIWIAPCFSAHLTSGCLGTGIQ